MKKDYKFYLIVFISLVFMFGFRYVPSFMGLSASGMQILGIFIGILLLWLFVAIDWPSLLLLIALATIPELKFSSIISGAYGNSTFVFLMFTFILTYALSQTSYIKRIALKFITSKIASRGPWYFVTLYSASIIFLGMFISPTVLFFVYLPIVNEIYELLNLEKGNKLASMLMMITVIMCGISSGMTPIAHVFPLIAMGLYSDMYGVVIDYARYMIMCIPVGIIVSVLVLMVFKYILRPNMDVLKNFDLNKINNINSKTSKDEKIILSIFIMVVLMWVMPGLIMLVIKNGIIYDLMYSFDKLGTAMPPLIGIVLLCIIHINQKPLLNINEAMKNGVSWPSLIMCAGTLALGSALTNNDIGFTIWLSNNLSPIISNMTPIIMVLIFALWAAIQTNFSSNMVTSTLVTTAVLTITSCLSTINIASVVVIVGMLASYSFATPPAMPCVAVAISSGYTSTKQMMLYGFIAMIISVIIATFIAYPIGTLIF